MTETYFLSFLQSRCLRSRCWQSWFFLRAMGKDSVPGLLLFLQVRPGIGSEERVLCPLILGRAPLGNEYRFFQYAGILSLISLVVHCFFPTYFFCIYLVLFFKCFMVNILTLSCLQVAAETLYCLLQNFFLI